MILQQQDIGCVPILFLKISRQPHKRRANGNCTSGSKEAYNQPRIRAYHKANMQHPTRRINIQCHPSNNSTHQSLLIAFKVVLLQIVVDSEVHHEISESSRVMGAAWQQLEGTPIDYHVQQGFLWGGHVLLSSPDQGDDENLHQDGGYIHENEESVEELAICQVHEVINNLDNKYALIRRVWVSIIILSVCILVMVDCFFHILCAAQRGLKVWVSI